MTPSSALDTTPRAWETVLRRIESDLIAGTIAPGDHLPPERGLATELGVGRSSVREAYRVLEVLGLIRTTSGSGPQSGAVVVARPSGGMSTLMRYQVAAQGYPVADVVTTRLVLEEAVVSALASAQAAATLEPAPHEPPTLAASHDLLEAMDAAALAPTDFLTLDAAFHLSLAEASGNTVIASMMAGLRDSIESYVVAGVPALSSWADTARRLQAEHRDILSAISAGDAGAARQRVHSHIARYYRETNIHHTDVGPTTITRADTP